MSTAAETTTRAVPTAVPRARRLKRSPLGRLLRKLPFWILIALIAIYALFPFYWAVRSAFTPDVSLFTTPVQYFPKHPTLQHFRDVLSSDFFRRALLNSTIVAGGGTPIPPPTRAPSPPSPRPLRVPRPPAGAALHPPVHILPPSPAPRA